MAGAFAGYFALTVWHLPWYIALALGMVVGWILGYLIEKVAFRPLRSAGHMPPLLITIGLSIILRDLANILFGAENRPVPSIYEQTFEVAGTQVSVLQILLLGIAVFLIVVLRMLIYGTKIGRAMRATAQDHEAAYAMGVNVNRVFSISFSLASCLGGAAGVMVGMYYNAVYASMGSSAGLKGFAACIFGGLTSIPGAILGGLIIGVVENLTVQYLASGYRDIVAFLVLVLVLVLRPQGLLGRRMRAV
jgi:branched-chain amino acid transport system permease protein